MRRILTAFALLAALLVAPAAPAAAAVTPVQVYGAWHCGNDFCTWGTTRTVAEFDTQNHWLIDRGDGRPSVNVVVLSFVDPAKLLHLTDDATTVDGIPRGITPEIVGYFTSRGIRVMLSIGGITYTDAWNAALAENAAQFGRNAADAARRLGVGIEIDYEENTSPNLTGLQAFIDAYRAVLPYDATGANPAARLTIDVAAGDRWLIALNRKATADWLRTDRPVLDYANAMVPARPASASSAVADWQEHIDGKSNYSPPVPPLAPAKFTAGLYVAYGNRPLPECTDYATSLQRATGTFVQSAAPNGAGTTAGLLGYMFWAAERPSTRGIGTVPPNTCQGGTGAGATAYQIQIPMPALRQS
ncbi:glycoside hydrolase family 18 protein [Dactylosporangium aurantiacum]|uniref:Glycoside hydrolase family 18 protein n=1 Tax=Dactylosporangium aurantiacum TaxID=35754 RepID=A0A9Q9MHJ2_9ACTN|nr:glycosyl hydrolase family 18 protein [Dactylosporangium aurantiacum]MDG6104181.1 glycosyl hydrolase family 18 protein [Dactylosporangium aurantiacum]UWZ56814.1 glycoside hydrolase family 18 protein [Dactylosporangium aurantiacum]